MLAIWGMKTTREIATGYIYVKQTYGIHADWYLQMHTDGQGSSLPKFSLF